MRRGRPELESGARSGTAPLHAGAECGLGGSAGIQSVQGRRVLHPRGLQHPPLRVFQHQHQLPPVQPLQQRPIGRADRQHRALREPASALGQRGRESLHVALQRQG